VSKEPLIAHMALVHEDNRRSIHEVSTLVDDGDGLIVQRLTLIHINEAAVLGNHYHDGREQFTLVQGRAKLITQTVEDGVATHDPQETLLEAPAYLSVQTGLAHTFVFDGPGILLAITNCLHEDLGTHKWDLA
jgi:hypothetical protein